MSYPRNVWSQLKNLTADRLIRALEADGWARDRTSGAQQIFRHPDGRRLSIHYHPGKTYGPKLLKGLLSDIGWSAADMRRLKLVK